MYSPEGVASGASNARKAMFGIDGGAGVGAEGGVAPPLLVRPQRITGAGRELWEAIADDDLFRADEDHLMM